MFSSTRPRRPDYIRSNSTFPLYHSHRKKPRRWPLVLRFIKGAIHVDIAIPVLLHAAFTTLICYLDQIRDDHLHLPSTIIPSLSIVVGLMLVFRNQTSYDRWWQGNQYLTTISTATRNLTRAFLTCSHDARSPTPPTPSERADTERTVRLLLALIYAAKNHLRAEWGASLPHLLPPSAQTMANHRRESLSTSKPEYTTLLPPSTRTHEEQGLGLLLQLSLHIEAYIKRAHARTWFHAPQAAQLSSQLATLVSAYGSLETIHLTPLPVAYQIHMRQVLALFCCALSFALVQEMEWWSVLMVGGVTFTLYGIEAIGAQLEDPFGYGRGDIKVDAIVEDLRVETEVLLGEWRRGGEMFDGVPFAGGDGERRGRWEEDG